LDEQYSASEACETMGVALAYLDFPWRGEGTLVPGGLRFFCQSGKNFDSVEMDGEVKKKRLKGVIAQKLCPFFCRRSSPG